MSATANNPKQTDDFISIQDLLYLCLSKWYWFAISLAITLAIAVLYIKMTPPTYVRTASILIKEDTKGGSLSGDVSGLSDIGLFQTNTNVNNEILSLKSPAIMLDVVKRLHLDINYTIPGSFHDKVIYGTNLPITASFIDLPDNETAQCSVSLLADNLIEVYDFQLNGEICESTQKIKGNLQDTLSTPVGKLVITPTKYYNGKTDTPIQVSKSNTLSTASGYAQHLSVSLSEEKSTVVDLSFSDVSIQRAEDVLNTLISVYNENWVKDKNQIAISTSMFINDRLAVIEQELGNVDEDISSFKSKNLLPNVEAASSMYMQQSSEATSQLQVLNNQLYMARYIHNYMTSNNGKNQLLPANSGIESSSIETQISEYNTAQLQRNNLVANSSEQNPLVIDLDQSLQSMRKAIITSIDNLIVTLNAQIKSVQQEEQQTTSRIAASPTQAKYLLSVERQQKVKEALYLFLLQKREENELSQAFTAYNTRIITPPYGKMIPTAPVKKNILTVAIALGLLIPVVIIFIMENMNTRVRGKKDIENLTLPFVGEIPLSYRKKKRLPFRKPQPESYSIVVKEKNRNVINEAFRVIRTNLEFMQGKNGHSPIIMVTSMNPGSGKTFISMNLATSLAIKGKKVLAIDLDLRKASLSTYIQSPEKGVTNYLIGQVNTYNEVIVKGETHPNLDILPVGTIPPNPTELLFENHLEQMLSELKNQYDYIFIDCPPVEIVADTSIINKYVDQTLFVIRAELLERAMLPEIEKFYQTHKYKNMVLLLNGTTDAYTRYGYHKYGYRYGYHYGYGSGYHQNSDEK